MYIVYMYIVYMYRISSIITRTLNSVLTQIVPAWPANCNEIVPALKKYLHHTPVQAMCLLPLHDTYVMKACCVSVTGRNGDKTIWRSGEKRKEKII